MKLKEIVNKLGWNLILMFYLVILFNINFGLIYTFIDLKPSFSSLLEIIVGILIVIIMLIANSLLVIIPATGSGLIVLLFFLFFWISIEGFGLCQEKTSFQLTQTIFKEYFFTFFNFFLLLISIAILVVSIITQDNYLMILSEKIVD